MSTPGLPISTVTTTEGATPQRIADIAEEGQLLAAGQKAAGWWENFWAAYHASRAKGHSYAVSLLVPTLQIALTAVIEFMTELQGKDNPQFYTFVAALLSDLLGVKVDAQVMRNAFAQGGDVAGMRAVGGAFIKTLAGEFGAGLDFDKDPRLAPAQTFLGFLLSFSARVGNVTFLAGLIPDIHADDIREYGEQMATNLGLGRLARRALGPFIDDLVAKPMQDALRSQLHPTDLAAPEAIRAFTRGLISEETFKKTLSNLGYSDDLVDVLRIEYLGRLNPDEITTMLRWKGIDEEGAVSLLKRFGYDPDTARALISTHELQRADTAISDYLSLVRKQLAERFISSGTFDKLVGELPIPDVHKEWERKIGGLIAETPSRRLSLSEMTRYYAEGLVDLDDFTTWAAASGFSDIETRLLTLDLLLRSPIEADKLAVERLKQQLAHRLLERRAAKAGLPPPPPLILAV